MNINVDRYLNHQWEQHCKQEEEAEEAELAFDQYEFDAKVKITIENYDIIKQVFIEAFTKGRES